MVKRPQVTGERSVRRGPWFVLAVPLAHEGELIVQHPERNAAQGGDHHGAHGHDLGQQARPGGGQFEDVGSAIARRPVMDDIGNPAC